MLGGGPLYNAAVTAPATEPGLTEFVKAPIRERAPTTNLIAGQGKFNPRLDEINFGQVGPRNPHLKNVGRQQGFRMPKINNHQGVSAPPQTQEQYPFMGAELVCPSGCDPAYIMDSDGKLRCVCAQDAHNAASKFVSAPPQTQGGRRKTYKNKSKKHRKNKSHKYRGVGCSGTVSIANAIKMRNCSWTRTNNGKAKLAPKMNLSNNMNSYYN